MSVRTYIPPPQPEEPPSDMVAGPPPEEPAAVPGAYVEPQEVFDPGEHTVDEVKEYVEEHPESVGQVMEDEAAGKNRVTLVNWLEEQEIPAEEDT